MARKARQEGGAVARRLTVAIEVMVIGAVLAVVPFLPFLMRKAAFGKALASLTFLGLLIFAAGATMYFISDRRTYRHILWWLLPMLKPPPRPWWEAPGKPPRRRASDPPATRPFMQGSRGSRSSNRASSRRDRGP